MHSYFISFSDCKSNRDCPRGGTCNIEVGHCNIDNVESTYKKPRVPRNKDSSPITFEECPFEAESAPKLNTKTFNRVKSSFDCETTCRKSSDCAYFEWQKVNGQNGRCTIYKHLIFEPRHTKSVSGLKNCGKKQELFKYDSCTLKDKKPVLKYVTTWKNLPSAQQCKQRCNGEKKCQVWEWQKFRHSDQDGDCHAYTMDFRTSANSMSGPVECRV